MEGSKRGGKGKDRSESVEDFEILSKPLCQVKSQFFDRSRIFSRLTFEASKRGESKFHTPTNFVHLNSTSQDDFYGG